jgi:hypothetical protein
VLLGERARRLENRAYNLAAPHKFGRASREAKRGEYRLRVPLARKPTDSESKNRLWLLPPTAAARLPQPIDHPIVFYLVAAGTAG